MNDAEPIATQPVIQQGREIKNTPQKEQDNKGEEELTNDITKMSASDSPIQQNKNDWVMVTKKKKNTRPNPIKGKNESSNTLNAAVKISWLFLSGLAPSTETADVIKHLQENQLGKDVICEKMTTKRDRYQRSFKLGIPVDRKDEKMAPELWNLH